MIGFDFAVSATGGANSEAISGLGLVVERHPETITMKLNSPHGTQHFIAVLTLQFRIPHQSNTPIGSEPCLPTSSGRLAKESPEDQSILLDGKPMTRDLGNGRSQYIAFSQPASAPSQCEVLLEQSAEGDTLSVSVSASDLVVTSRPSTFGSIQRHVTRHISDSDACECRHLMGRYRFLILLIDFNRE
ncbi:hypothetical protein Rcae01_04543 [Novipirellula caenicola]|uniref:Uncharacterized protein n=1 Tax=Novipirellula caenicola TaxID=1536901 RepID=A0ABP9VVA0_9BACT